MGSQELTIFRRRHSITTLMLLYSHNDRYRWKSRKSV